jgi:hypothetical protein
MISGWIPQQTLHLRCKAPKHFNTLVKSYLNIDIPFDQFLKITEIRQIQDLSIYWSLDGVFHETKSSSLVQKEDVMRFLDENRCEIISVHFVCNGMFEIESNGRNETVISVHEPSIIESEEKNRDYMHRDELHANLEESDRRKSVAVLHTRRVE